MRFYYNIFVVTAYLAIVSFKSSVEFISKSTDDDELDQRRNIWYIFIKSVLSSLSATIYVILIEENNLLDLTDFLCYTIPLFSLY